MPTIAATTSRCLPACMFSDYTALAGQAKAEELAKKVQARGVNMERLLGSLQQQ